MNGDDLIKQCARRLPAIPLSGQELTEVTHQGFQVTFKWTLINGEQYRWLVTNIESLPIGTL
jgi:hypothetical protein